VHAVRTPARRVRATRRHYARAGIGGAVKSVGRLAISAVSIGIGYSLSDALDRYLATYNPAGDEKPTNKFTSDGAGTMANALNVASPPHLHRALALAGAIVVPAIASGHVKNHYLKASLEAVALGAGVKAFTTLWTNVVVPMLAPKDTSALQGSVIARLYPSEVAAKLNLDSATTSASGQSFGALSSAPIGDVGPLALGGDSPYPDAVQVFRRQAGVSDNENYPSAAQALRHEAGLGYVRRPAPPGASRFQFSHPMYRPGGVAHFANLSNRWSRAGFNTPYAIPSAPGTAPHHKHHHHHCMARAKGLYPTYTDAQLHAWCLAHPYGHYPYLYESPASPVAPPAPPIQGGVSDAPADGGGGGEPPPADASAAPPAAGDGALPTAPPPANPVGPPTYSPGPPATPGPGPVPMNSAGGEGCGCVGENNSFLGFIGDEEKDSLVLS